MASSLFILLDDLASILDDVAAMTKVAAGKTAGVLGDDLALNAEQVSGVIAERELPVVWAVAKGSLLNKAILVPAAVAISTFIPWAITPLLMCGGAFLCFEGFEKLAHRFFHQADKTDEPKLTEAAARSADELKAVEKEKIKGAIRTDFILSAEIIVISLGTVASATLAQQIAVLIVIAITMTAGVYGLVAAIVKLDDLGYHLLRRKTAFANSIGRAILSFAPFLMKSLANLGTAAMFLVGGGILVHGIHILSEFASTLTSPETFAARVVPLVVNLSIGLLMGAVIYGFVAVINRIKNHRVY